MLYQAPAHADASPALGGGGGGGLAHPASIHSEPTLDPAYAQFRDQTRFWVQRVAVPMIMVVGLFGNLITIIIMTRRRMRSTTNMYLAALAFVDMLYLVLTFVLGLSHYPNMARRRYHAYWQLKPFLMMLTDACSNTSVWLTVTFTIERFIAVRFPMKGKVWCTEARAKRLIVCVFLFGILFALPVPFEWKVIERRAPSSVVGSLQLQPRPSPSPPQMQLHPSTQPADARNVGWANLNSNPAAAAASSMSAANKLEADILRPSGGGGGARRTAQKAGGPATLEQTDTRRNGDHDEAGEQAGDEDEDEDEESTLALEYTEVGSNENYKTIYYWSTAAIFYFIPLLSLTFFNGFLIHSVHKSRRKRNEMTSRQGGEHVQGRARQRLRAPELAARRPAAAVLKQCASQLSKLRLKSCTGPATRNATSTSKQQLESIEETIGDHEFKRRADTGQHAGPTIGCDTNNISATSTNTTANTNANNNNSNTNINNNNNDDGKLDTPADCSSCIGAGSHPDATATAAGSAAAAWAEQRDSTLGRARQLELGQAARDQMNRQAGAITRLNLAGQDNRGTGAASETLIRAQQKTSAAPAASARGMRAAQRLAAGADSVPTGTLNVAAHDNHHPLSPSPSCNLVGAPTTGQQQQQQQQQQQPGPLAPASSQERRITIMLISVVILFLVCQIPSAAMILYTSVHEAAPNTNEHALVLAFGNIFNFLMAINAAGNFILYSFLSNKYRRTFVILFCGCLRRRRANGAHAYRAQTSHFLATKTSSNGASSSGNGGGDGGGSGSFEKSGQVRRWASVRFSRTPAAPLPARHLVAASCAADEDESSQPNCNPGEQLITQANYGRKRRDTLV